MEPIDALVEAVQQSAKYGDLCPKLIRRLGQRELTIRRTLKEAIKETKNALHQATGAYLGAKPRYASWLQALEQAQTEGDDALRAVCLRVLGTHASTRERLPFLSEFYATLFADLPPVRSLLDVGCGFHPLALLWMPVERANLRYSGCELSASLTKFLQSAVGLFGVAGQFETIDAMTFSALESLSEPVDVALVLKLIPVLEQSEKGAGARLLRVLPARTLIVSYPTRSLGGRGKGMSEHYEAQFRALANAENWHVTRYLFPTELCFRIER
jgi:16S rRNA (guanine(1405)-N(7))-methyltransferase